MFSLLGGAPELVILGLVLLLDAPPAEVAVQREIGAVLARRRTTAERLGHVAHVVRRAAATDADEVHADVVGVLRELAHVLAGEHLALERERERRLALAVLQLQEGDAVASRVVRHLKVE